MTERRPGSWLSIVIVTVRLAAAVAASWLLVGVVTPSADPFVVDVGWLLIVTLVLAIPRSRRVVSRWIRTGRLRGPRA